VVCVRKASLSGSSTWSASTAAMESTTRVRSGASPEGCQRFPGDPYGDQNDSALFAGELEGFEMHLGDEGASCINHTKRTVLGFLANGGRNAMGTEDQDGIGRDFFNGFDENGAAAAELFHNVGVVDDFVMPRRPARHRLRALAPQCRLRERLRRRTRGDAHGAGFWFPFGWPSGS